MSSVNFRGRSLQHFLSQRPALHVSPKTFARQFVLNHGARDRSTGVETIVIQHVERGDLPTLPIFHAAQEMNWYSRFMEISIRQISQRLTGNLSPFDYNRTATAPRFCGRIQIQGFDQRGRRVRKTLWHKPLRQLSSVLQKHFHTGVRRLMTRRFQTFAPRRSFGSRLRP